MRSVKFYLVISVDGHYHEKHRLQINGHWKRWLALITTIWHKQRSCVPFSEYLALFSFARVKRENSICFEIFNFASESLVRNIPFENRILLMTVTIFLRRTKFNLTQPTGWILIYITIQLFPFRQTKGKASLTLFVSRSWWNKRNQRRHKRTCNGNLVF